MIIQFKKISKMKNLYIFLLLLVGIGGFGQKRVTKQTCYTDEIMEGLKKSNPEIKSRLDYLDQVISKDLQNLKKVNLTEITIPVVFFIVHDNQPLGVGANITDAQVMSQLTALNNYFTGSGIKFCLATKAGVTNINSINHINNTTLSNHDTGSLSQLVSAGLSATNNQVDQARYLRVFVVKSINNSTIGGYTFLSGNIYTQNDCIVVRSDLFGDVSTFPNGIYMPNYDQGKVMVHEVGHYFGLYHTFQESCLNDNCNAQGDRVCDTPPVNAANFACIANTDTCNENPNFPDNIQNYMDYTDDVCKNNFTTGQKNRMLSEINNFRSEMISTDNQIFTGTCGSNLLISASFEPSAYQTCTNNLVTFTPISTGVGLTYSWDFGDVASGANNFSTLYNPSHTYLSATNSPYVVTLTISNGTQNYTYSTNIYVSICMPILNSESNWRFGNYPDGSVNAINFSSGIPVTSLVVDASAPYRYTSAVQSSSNGELLFKTNGGIVSDNNNNWSFLSIINNYSNSTVQNGSIIIKNPNLLLPNQYYMFIKDAYESTNTNHGFRYSLIDAPNQSNVTSAINNRNLAVLVPPSFGYLLSSDGGILGGTSVTAIAAQDGYWIITRGKKSGFYFLMVFKLNSSGITFISELQTNKPSSAPGVDYIDVAPNGNKIVVGEFIDANLSSSSVYSFNKFTGQIINDPIGNLGNIRGRSAFSPNSNLLYMSFYNTSPFPNSLQLNLQDLNQNSFKKAFSSSNIGAYGDIQRGPDNKLYYSYTRLNPTRKLQVIHNPNGLNTTANPNACQFSPNGPTFSATINTAATALPNMLNAKKETAFEVNAISSYPTACLSRLFFPDSYGTSFNWDFGDPASGVNNTYSGTLISHTFSNSGTYIVTLRSATNIFIAQTSILVGLPAKIILGSTGVCVSGINNNSNIMNNSVLLASGETAIWSITGGTGTISGANNQSDVTINWTTLPGTITLTVTNTSGCVATATKIINSLPVVNPTFNTIAPICSGTTLSPLPTTSTNGITGTWSPALNNTETTLYTFTPATGLCATTATLTITVLPANDPSCVTNPCLPNLTLNTPEGNSTITYKRLNWIETNANYTTSISQDVKMKAGDFINLKSGTHIKSGSLYLGKIEACTATSKMSIQETKISAIESIESDSFITIYPNPTKENVTIASTSSKIKSMAVSSTEGKTFFINNSINNEQYVLDASNYQKGIYIITIETIDGKIVRQKLIKN